MRTFQMLICRFLFFVFLFYFIGVPVETLAQPLLGGPDQWDIPVSVDGNPEIITVIRDANKPEVWYYAPPRPRLVMNERGEPVFMMLKYQGVSEEDSEKFVDGAILQFSVRLGLPPETVTALESRIKKLYNQKDSEKIRVTSLPFSDVKMSVMSPSGDFITNSDQLSDITTSFAQSEVPFQINLNKMGHDVYKALCEGNTGLPVWVSYNYYTITPPASIKIRAEWDKIYKQVSKDLKLRDEVVVAGSGFAESQDRTYIREKLNSMEGLEIETIGNEDAWSNADFEKTVDRLSELVYKELFETSSTIITKVDPAAAKEVMPKVDGQPVKTGNATDVAEIAGKLIEGVAKGTGKAVTQLSEAMATQGLSMVIPQVKVGFSYAMKDIEKVQKGKVVVDINRRKILKRLGGCGTFIGVGKYIQKNKSLQDKLFKTIAPGNWEQATFLLPTLDESIAERGFSGISISVSVVDISKKDGARPYKNYGNTKSAVFDLASGKWKFAKNEVTSLLFPLAALVEKEKDNIKNYRYLVETKLGVKEKNSFYEVKSEVLRPLSEYGDITMSNPVESVVGIQIKCEDLFEDENLVAVKIKLTPDKGKPRSVAIDNKTTDKNPFLYFPKDLQGNDPKIKANIEYTVKQEGARSKKIQSELNKLPDLLAAEGDYILLEKEWAFDEPEKTESSDEEK